MKEKKFPSSQFPPPLSALQKTAIRRLKETRQIINSKTKKDGKKQQKLAKNYDKSYMKIVNKTINSSVRSPWTKDFTKIL